MTNYREDIKLCQHGYESKIKAKLHNGFFSLSGLRSGAHVSTANITAPRSVGPPQVWQCLVVISRLSWCSTSLSLSLSLASPLTLQVSFIEPAVIYRTLVFPLRSRNQAPR